MEEKVPSPLVNTKPHLEKLTLGITRILEASPGVTKVQIIEKEPAERHMIASWELKNDCAMPEDLKNFYLMTNGFHMVWSVKLDDQPVPLGSLVINSISNLTQLTQSAVYTLPNSPTLEDLEDEEDEANEDRPEKPHFDARSVIFELDSCNGNGKVCLVYRRTSPVAKESKIWFLDRALYWHFLTDNFTSYYRLLITHMGLPQWQYAFTNYGVSPQAKVGEEGLSVPRPSGSSKHLPQIAQHVSLSFPVPAHHFWFLSLAICHFLENVWAWLGWGEGTGFAMHLL
uniref:Tubulin polyglutamylase complex subunit 2-like n=1 Tax=Monodelphis domestica TaxID=13616 RepID=A0A5F8GN52_MONDO